MHYNDRPKSYLNRLVNDLRDAKHVLNILYTSSLSRAEREKTSLSTALIKNLGDVYNNGLDSLLVPVSAYGSGVVYELQVTRTPTEFFMGSKSNRHRRPTSNKQWREKQKEKKKRKEHRNWLKSSG